MVAQISLAVSQRAAEVARDGDQHHQNGKTDAVDRHLRSVGRRAKHRDRPDQRCHHGGRGRDDAEELVAIERCAAIPA